MSINFSSNQYEGAFVSHRLQNWEVPMQHKNATWFNDHYQSGRPKAQEGFTQIIANDRGHINECIPRSEKNPWGDFVGTWDLPKKIPGNCATVQTARCANAQDLLQRHKKEANGVMGGQQKNTTRQYKGQIPNAIVPIKEPRPWSDCTSPKSVVISSDSYRNKDKPRKVFRETAYPKKDDYDSLTPVESSGKIFPLNNKKSSSMSSTRSVDKVIHVSPLPPRIAETSNSPRPPSSERLSPIVSQRTEKSNTSRPSSSDKLTPIASQRAEKSSPVMPSGETYTSAPLGANKATPVLHECPQEFVSIDRSAAPRIAGEC